MHLVFSALDINAYFHLLLYLCYSLLFILAKDSFKIKITSLEKEHLRIHVPPPLDRGDGSLLVRYRLYGSSTEGLKIEVLYKDKPVTKSPYTLTGT